MTDHDQESDSYYEYNWLGRVVYIGGLATRGAARIIDRGIEEAAATLKEAEKAFYDELDPNVEDAKVLNEENDSP